MSRITVRQFRKEDQERVVELYLAGLHSYTEENSIPEVPKITRRFAEARCTNDGDMVDIEKSFLRDDHRKTFLVAEDESGKVVGCVGAIPSTEFNPDEYLELVRMSVDHSCRGSGVGVKLVEAFEDWARSQGYKHLNLTTLDGMKSAFRFYSKNGYQLIKDKQMRLDLTKYGIPTGENAQDVHVVHYVKHLD